MICMSRRRRRSSAPLALQKVVAVKNDAARGWLNQAQDEASERAFAGAGFAHQAQGFTFVDRKRNIVDGADDSAVIFGALIAERRFR